MPKGTASLTEQPYKHQHWRTFSINLQSREFILTLLSCRVNESLLTLQSSLIKSDRFLSAAIFNK